MGKNYDNFAKQFKKQYSFDEESIKTFEGRLAIANFVCDYWRELTNTAPEEMPFEQNFPDEVYYFCRELDQDLEVDIDEDFLEAWAIVQENFSESFLVTLHTGE